MLIRKLVTTSLLFLLVSCATDEPQQPTFAASAQELRVATGEDATFLSVDFLLTDAEGQALPCSENDVSLSLTLRDSEGATTELPADALQVRCASEAAEIALVIDNSGSEKGNLDVLVDSAERLVNRVTGLGGSASVVRVSTEAEVLAPLTSQKQALEQALAELRIVNGWTALYDGIRLGNETLGGDAVRATSVTDRETFCSTKVKHGIVVFTDGMENNSSDDHASEAYPGDGVSTRLEDLMELNVEGVSTPVYSIGLGRNVDHAGLEKLAQQTGGRHTPLATEEGIEAAFSAVEEYIGPGRQVCAELPERLCGSLDAELNYTYEVNGELFSSSRGFKLHVDCPDAPSTGRTATILLTLSNPGIPPAEAQVLVGNAARWVSEDDSPRVLVVLDDSHHDENPEDAAFVRELLLAEGIRADYLEEPKDGLSVSDIQGQDVVWFTNPGHPMDDLATFDTLKQFSAAGGAVVLQGDDISWAFGRAFDLSELTGVKFTNNGTRRCGRAVNNNRYDTAHAVSFGEHAMVQGLDNALWLYGDDIDHVTAASGTTIVADAAFTRRDGTSLCDGLIPVVVVKTP